MPTPLYYGNGTSDWANGTNSTVTVWNQWVTTTNTTSNTVATYIWDAWQVAPNNYAVNYKAPPPPTAAEIAERRRQEAERERERVAASRRAAQLLMDHLTKEQAKAYGKGAFRVVGSSGRTYEVGRQSQAGNVVELDRRGRKIARYCIHPSIGVPNEDAHLAQKLLLETDEEAFRRIANRTAIAA